MSWNTLIKFVILIGLVLIVMSQAIDKIAIANIAFHSSLINKQILKLQNDIHNAETNFLYIDKELDNACQLAASAVIEDSHTSKSILIVAVLSKISRALETVQHPLNSVTADIETFNQSLNSLVYQEESNENFFFTYIDRLRDHLVMEKDNRIESLKADIILQEIKQNNLSIRLIALLVCSVLLFFFGTWLVLANDWRSNES